MDGMYYELPEELRLDLDGLLYRLAENAEACLWKRLCGHGEPPSERLGCALTVLGDRSDGTGDYFARLTVDFPLWVESDALSRMPQVSLVRAVDECLEELTDICEDYVEWEKAHSALRGALEECLRAVDASAASRSPEG